MRSYGQYCGLAKALDAVGDRWSLLIVRELTIRGACRYTDLRNGLPGVATNLLADRLRDLETAGVIHRYDAPPPVATALFELTERGRGLERAIVELGRWGAPLLADAPKSDAFRGHWLALPLREFLRDHAPGEPSLEIEVRSAGDPVTVEVGGGKVRIHIRAAANPAVTIGGTPKVVLGVLLGKLNLAQARAAGLKCKGDPAALRRVQPAA